MPTVPEVCTVFFFFRFFGLFGKRHCPSCGWDKYFFSVITTTGPRRSESHIGRTSDIVLFFCCCLMRLNILSKTETIYRDFYSVSTWRTTESRSESSVLSAIVHRRDGVKLIFPLIYTESAAAIVYLKNTLNLKLKYINTWPNWIFFLNAFFFIKKKTQRITLFRLPRLHIS